MSTWLFACPYTDFARARQWRIINNVLLGAVAAFAANLLLGLLLALGSSEIGSTRLLIMGGAFLLTLCAFGLHRAGHSTAAAWLIIVIPGPPMSLLSALVFPPLNRTLVQSYMVVPI